MEYIVIVFIIHQLANCFRAGESVLLNTVVLLGSVLLIVIVYILFIIEIITRVLFSTV